MGHNIDYFGWNCDGFEEIEADESPKSSYYETIKCPEEGCQNGWIVLFVSRSKCPKCNGTGKIKQRRQSK